MVTIFVPIPATYFTIYVGLFNPQRLTFMKSGDYSYGIYLYGFPIQQTVASLGPWTHNWAINLALSIPSVAFVAAFSWHGIEKHALKLRHYLPAVEDALTANVLGRFGQRRSVPAASE